MEYSLFKSELKRARMSVRELARLLDMEPNSITNYKAKGNVPRHLAVVVLLLAAVEARNIPRKSVFGSGW